MRKEYRREDQYLSIELQPEGVHSPLPRNRIPEIGAESWDGGHADVGRIQ